MESKSLAKAALAAFLLASILPVDGQADIEVTETYPTYLASAACGNLSSSGSYQPQSYTSSYEVPGDYSYEYDNRHYLYEKRPYDTGTYYYDRSGSRYERMNRYNGYYNTSYNAGAYTSGISSYPGTSTGPGISNGYHGTPKGIYSTDSRYYDRNIRPNPDVYYQSRR